MLICTCPIDVDCIAWGSGFECFPWCDYLQEDGTKEEEDETDRCI